MEKTMEGTKQLLWFGIEEVISQILELFLPMNISGRFQTVGLNDIQNSAKELSNTLNKMENDDCPHVDAGITNAEHLIDFVMYC